MLTLSTTTATPSILEDVVVVLGLVEGERVLEAGAAAAADGDAQRLLGGVLLAAEQLPDLPAALSVRVIGRCCRLYPVSASRFV